MIGRIHSVESFGTVDGPGVRFVIFFQGCPMRCLYCHNPDTWDPKGGEELSVEELLSRFRKNRAFYQQGGITATGGEPLLQLPFLTALFEAAKAEGIHTCLDTAGIVFRDSEAFARLVAVTDLVLLDIKHIDPEAHRRLTGVSNAPVLAFARYLDAHRVPMHIRHVVVEGYTDDDASLLALGQFIGTLHTVQAVDILPYHTLGEAKYASLGLPYPLPAVPPLSQKAAARAKETVLEGVRQSREHANH